MYTKPFYVAVQPVGSKFAKALQAAIKTMVRNRVYRALPHRVRRGRSQFSVTTQPLNKIEQFNAFKLNNVNAPAFTTDPRAVDTLGSKTIFARQLINATNGRGIVEFQLGDVVPRAPLYTAYIPKKAEYRVHVMGGQVIDVQQKKKRKEFDNDRDTRIRNLHNGYVYCRGDIDLPGMAADLAVRAVMAVGYLYGAVDIVYNEKRDQCYVLEVNSRPGLMGTTLERYAAAIVRAYNLWRK